MMIISYLNVNDIISCSITCKQLHKITSSNKLWHDLYKQKWSLTSSNGCEDELKWQMIYKQKHCSLNHLSGTPGGCGMLKKPESQYFYKLFVIHLDFVIPVDATVVMLGAAGTGKTSLMQYLVSDCFINTESSSQRYVPFFCIFLMFFVISKV